MDGCFPTLPPRVMPNHFALHATGPHHIHAQDAQLRDVLPVLPAGQGPAQRDAQGHGARHHKGGDHRWV